MGQESIVDGSPRAWLAAALRGEAPAWQAAANASGRELIDRAEEEGVAALVQSLGATRSLPAGLQQAFAHAERTRIAAEMLDRAELVRVLRVLAQARVPTLLLKGAALAYSIYPAPHLRPRTDVDLLFPDQAAMLQASRALAPLGYTATQVPADSMIGYETSLQRTTAAGYCHQLDAHWKLANQAIFADALAWPDLEAQSIALPGLDPDARGLSVLHALLHGCLHRISHLTWDADSGVHGDRLIWLYDFHLLVQRFDQDDFDDLLRIAAQRGLAGACHDGLQEAQRAFATPLPTGLLAELEVAAGKESFDVSKARRRWYQELHNLRTVPTGKRLAFVREKMFPSAAYMRELYPVNGPASLAWAYLRRLGNGVRLALFGKR